jgi:hypothetical protein
VRSPARDRWKLLTWCFAAAVAWELLWSSVLDPDSRVTLYFATSAPAWLQHLHAWRPAALSLRILNIFGWRFDVQHYDSNTGLVLVSMTIEALIWAGILYVAAVWVQGVRRKRDEAAVA